MSSRAILAELADEDLRGCGAHCQAWEFGVHFHVHCFIGLDADDEFVAWDVLENTTCDIIKLDSNFSFLFVESCVNKIRGRYLFPL
jgi:hypothetical protein